MLRKRGLNMTPLRRDLPSHRASRRYFGRMLEKWLKSARELPAPDWKKRRED
jgi:hypothetical protein